MGAAKSGLQLWPGLLGLCAFHGGFRSLIQLCGGSLALYAHRCHSGLIFCGAAPQR